ncbi:MAG: UPF0236 family transposase-like protein [Bacillota bacterium]
MKDKRAGESVFLLDKMLGLEGRERLSPGVRAIGLELATEMPFVRAAEVMGRMVTSVSGMVLELRARRGVGRHRLFLEEFLAAAEVGGVP